MPRIKLTMAALAFTLGVAPFTGVHAGGEAGEVIEVEIRKFKFIPAEITIKAGDTVRWINREKRQYHSVWFEQLGEAEPDYLFPGDTYERTFDSRGGFPYRCGPHPKMTGVVRVD
jgi:plastocyanin